MKKVRYLLEGKLFWSVSCNILSFLYGAVRYQEKIRYWVAAASARYPVSVSHNSGIGSGAGRITGVLWSDPDMHAAILIIVRSCQNCTETGVGFRSGSEKTRFFIIISYRTGIPTARATIHRIKSARHDCYYGWRKIKYSILFYSIRCQ